MCNFITFSSIVNNSIFEIKEIILIEIIFYFYFIADKYYKNYKNLS